MNNRLRLPLALALALGSSQALALGLGQIEVKSGLNQPLQAEIPVVATAAEGEGLQVRLAPIRNDFYGSSVTVAGLMTGADIVAQLRGAPLGDAVVVPAVALRGDRFLDDQRLADVERQLGVPIEVVPPTARGLLAAALGA